VTTIEYLSASALLAILLGLACSMLLRTRTVRHWFARRTVERACRNARRRAAERREQAARCRAWWGGGPRG